ncbi:coiled-coil domain-containing protein 189 isoform X2 [Protopterus annectens]|uniref:coiled-coil domain-containing protein 189 isoform X2 n=1 Tax=Protopterus annectens TaxID=7888 RepID=UPI001CFA1A18|nr:coiled-coil domain-containing protein 189 isoform X2 [Protopterus annectens]
MTESPCAAMTKLKMPREHKAKICLCVLVELFRLQDAATNPRSAILLDLYFYTVQFCRENGFNREQTSALFSIVKKTHEACTETPLGNVDQCYNYFIDLVFCHAVKRPPFSIDLFDQDQVQLVTEYVVNTYFRHFKLYKYVFTPQMSVDLTLTYVGMPKSEESQEVEQEDMTVHSVETPVEEKTESIQPEVPVSADADPKAALRAFIRSQVNEEVAQIRQSLEERLKLNEEQLMANISPLEPSPIPRKKTGSSKGKKK